MQTIREQKIIAPAGFHSVLSSPARVSLNEAKRLKIREFISWAVCFGVVAGLTGLLKILKVGVTMESVTSTLFYLAFAGLVYFIFRIVKISKNAEGPDSRNLQDLN